MNKETIRLGIKYWDNLSKEVFKMIREKSIVKPDVSEKRSLETWDSFRDMERMFRDFFMAPFNMMRTPGWVSERLSEFIPDVDMRESEKEIIISASLPGMEKDNINVDVTKDSITISGERKHEEERPNERYHVRQQSRGTFNISMSLPAEVNSDEAKATYKKGILEITMPKMEVTEAHKIPIQAIE